MTVGVNDICGELKNKREIYVLDDDNDTDFDFYVFIDSEEMRRKNEFLRKLYDYIKKKNNKNELLNGDSDSVGIKSLIEKYPYRLFVVIDPEEWKMDGKSPLDNDFPWNNYSDFLKKRICWIEKGKFNKAFGSNNTGILSLKKLDNSNNNILDDNEKFEPFHRAQLWLYYKWVEHMLKNAGINDKNIYILFGIGSDPRAYKPITFPSERGGGSTIKKHCIGDKIYVLSGKSVEKYNVSQNDAPFIGFERHDPHILYSAHYQKCLYAEGVSGSQYQLPLLISLNPDTSEGIKLTFLIVENALNKILIVDERFSNWFHSLSALDILKLAWVGVFITDEIEIDGTKIISTTDLDKSNIFGKLMISKNGEIPVDLCGLETILNKLKEDLENEDSKKDAVSYFKSNLTQNIQTLIIHQGILDKIEWNKNTFNSPKEFITFLKDKIPNVIITSGRGKPENLPPYEKFIPFSNLEYLMKNYPDKLIFTKLMFRVSELTGGKI